MTTRANAPESVAAHSDSRYTEPHERAAAAREMDRPRRPDMVFRRTEEAEWTKFSKALPSRDRDEADADDPDATASHPIVPQGSPMTRQAASDVSVAARPVSRPPAAEVDEDVESIIGEHTTVDGTFKSENSIRIRGSVQGEIESQRSILVEAQANVNAKVTASSITVAGQVNGQIFCSGRVEIRPSGRVIGEINAGTLIMQEGAFFEGNLKMGGRGGASATTEPTPAVGAKKS
jgi:cytoskeletal protein CcmA (bactofilin family)